MDDIINLVATDAPASEITDAIKQSLYARSAERIELLRPEMAKMMFDTNQETETEE